MRKSFGVALIAAVALVGAVLVIAFWLPAMHASQDQKWREAGQRALARVTLPPTFHLFDDAGSRRKPCVNDTVQRCFVAAGDPRVNVAAVQAALSTSTNRPGRATCQLTALANSPATCSLEVSVAGSKLRVDLFARAIIKGRHVADWTYNGSYVDLHVDAR